MAAQPDEVDPARLMILELLGAGTVSEVYRTLLHPAHDDGAGNDPREVQHVALKRIDWPEWSVGIIEHRAWTREVEALQTLDHPNIVRLLGVQSAMKPLGILIELCAGSDLFYLLHAPEGDRVELTWAQKRKMSLDSALAMEYLHSRNPPILHRDMKSLNLLLTFPLTGPADIPLVKLSDFGLARTVPARAAGPGLQVQGRQLSSCVGSPQWMAPEVFCGRQYDEKADVYSFGIVLHEILCRAIPFPDVDPRVLKESVLRGARPDVDMMPPHCPEGLRHLMAVCWERRPAKRPDFERIVRVLHML